MCKNHLIMHNIYMLLCFNLFANPYDLCKDILRDGVRDKLSTQGNFEQALALQHQFCSIAKEHDLNERNFHNFAHAYAKETQVSKNNYNANAAFGLGLLSFGANYTQINIDKDMSLLDKENLFKDNKIKILEYYNENCSNKDQEESLKSEAISLSKIANPFIVQAWRDCMLRHTDFFADLIPSSIDMADDEIEYNIMINWRSDENTEITSIVLRYSQDKISTPYQVIEEEAQFVKTVNICKSEESVLKSGSTFPLTILHKNRLRNANISIIALTNTGAIKSHVLILPKIILPKPIAVELNNSYWSMDIYCNNFNCQNYMKNTTSIKHEIGKEFIIYEKETNCYSCEDCNHTKKLRFSFKNCKYKYKLRRGIVVVESDEYTASDSVQYLYPFNDDVNAYTKLQIITDN